MLPCVLTMLPRRGLHFRRKCPGRIIAIVLTIIIVVIIIALIGIAIAIAQQ